MALAETTLAAAVGAGDNYITVASATSVAVGRLLQVDGEFMKVRIDYVTASTTVPVRRGQSSTAQAAHVSSARVVHGDPSDWGVSSAGAAAQFSPGTIVRKRVSYSASGAITLPQPGEDLLVVLNGTSVLAMTLAVPTKDLDGCEITIIGNGAAAHTLTVASGLSGAGGSYDVLTTNATAPTAKKLVACNEFWYAYAAIPISGTVTNVTDALA